MSLYTKTEEKKYVLYLFPFVIEYNSLSQALLKSLASCFMRGAYSSTLLFNSNINKTKRAIRKSKRREEVVVPLPNLSDFSSNKEIGDMECITLGDYGRLDNIDEVAQGFQLVNPLHFDIKYPVLSALRENQFLGRVFEDCNAHLTHFLERVCIKKYEFVRDRDNN